MFDDYYSHHPRVYLDRPIILTGYSHNDSRRVAHFLAGQTGLVLLDVDDAVAHALGQSIIGLRKRDGRYAYLADEASALRRLVKQRPAGIVRVGKDCFLDRRVIRDVGAHADIWYIDRPRAFEEPTEDTDRAWTDVFKQLGQALRPNVRDSADRIIAGGTRHALNVAREIVDLLKATHGAELAGQTRSD